MSPAARPAAEIDRFMKLALRESEKGRGFTEPNPMVGAVVVKNGRILACGHHRRYGQEHAERMALATVEEPGTTLYVTLEPCAHHGKTPPCTDIILEKRVKKVVAAMEDPNPLVSGKGLAALRRHGVAVEVGVMRAQAAEINRHYLHYITTGLPWVALHAGLSLDGKMTDRNGRSQWITSELSRRLSHSLRGEFSAILAGRGTASADNPQLTVREEAWREKTLFRVVLDSRNTLPADLHIFEPQPQFPLILFSSRRAADQRPRCERHFFVDEAEDGLDFRQILTQLGRLGIASLFVEGGGGVLDSLLRRQLFDEVYFFLEYKLVGGRRSVEPFAGGVEDLSRALRLVRVETLRLDTGIVVRGYRTCSPD